MAPIPAAPTTAIRRLLWVSQVRKRCTATTVRSGGHEIADQGDLQEDQEHDVEAEDDEDLAGRSVFQLLKVVERREVGDAGKREDDTEREGDAGIATAEQLLDLGGALLGFLGIRLVLLRLAPLFQSLVATAAQHIGNEQEDRPEGDVHRGAEGVLRGFRRARVMHDEDDHEADREADQQGAGQVAEQQPLRALQEQHHRHRREQGGVRRGYQ